MQDEYILVLNTLSGDISFIDPKDDSVVGAVRVEEKPRDLGPLFDSADVLGTGQRELGQYEEFGCPKAMLDPSVAKKGELDGAAEGVQVMQQSVLHRLIGRHAQCQATMGTYQTAGTLDELAPQRTESEKVPQGRAFLQGQAGGGMGNHLQFPHQVVGQQHAQQVDLVPDPGARGT